MKLYALAAAGLVVSCSNGGFHSSPVCQPWLNQVRQEGGGLRVLAANTTAAGTLQALLRNNGAVALGVDDGAGWLTTRVDSVDSTTQRGVLLTGSTGPVALYLAHGLTVAQSISGAPWTTANVSPAAENAEDVAAFRDVQGTLHAAYVTHTPRALHLAEQRSGGTWDVVNLEVPSRVPVEGLATVAITQALNGELWVALSAGPDIWAGRAHADGTWTWQALRVGGTEEVAEMAATQDGAGRAWLVYRTQDAVQAHLWAMPLAPESGPQSERLLDLALRNSDGARLMTAGTDDQGRLRVLHARTASQMVYTVFAPPELERDVVDLAGDVSITSVQGVLAPGSVTLVETHSQPGADEQLVTHRCQQAG